MNSIPVILKFLQATNLMTFLSRPYLTAWRPFFILSWKLIKSSSLGMISIKPRWRLSGSMRAKAPVLGFGLLQRVWGICEHISLFANAWTSASLSSLVRYLVSLDSWFPLNVKSLRWGSKARTNSLLAKIQRYFLNGNGTNSIWKFTYFGLNDKQAMIKSISEFTLSESCCRKKIKLCKVTSLKVGCDRHCLVCAERTWKKNRI